MIIELIYKKRKRGEKIVSVLIDPDKTHGNRLQDTITLINRSNIDILMVGGSLISEDIDQTLKTIREYAHLPVVLFPGSLLQISNEADAILLLSLISGRNPEYLIGNHVVAAPMLKKSNLEVIPTGYILVENGTVSSTQYISNTAPVPRDKYDLAIATAIAGELLGNKLIYLEAGSGAKLAVPIEMIRLVKENIGIPLIVGGGIRSNEQADDIFNAGADMIVIGNAFETNPELLLSF